jgi:hypothetical protein
VQAVWHAQRLTLPDLSLPAARDLNPTRQR